MAIIKWDDDGSQYYVPDALLYGNDPAAAWAAAIPLEIYQAQLRIAGLKEQIAANPRQPEALLLAWARQNNPHEQQITLLENQLATAENEVTQWQSR